MTLGVVLGAGFSKAVDSRLPLVDELGELVRERVPRALEGAPPRFIGGSFERWLSRIAEPQPDLDDAANLQNARDFVLVTTAIHEIMVDIEAEIFQSEIPWWLLRFVGLLHRQRATVVTFNYDTVIEAVAARTTRYGESANLNTFSVTDGLPPTPPAAGMYGPLYTATFRLLKLHGSLDTYWVRGDTAGTSITRVGEAIWARARTLGGSAQDVARRAPGRVPFIVPPASAKSAFFANPITRELWRTAAARLARCDRIVVMGYSMPLTDIVASAMLAAAQRRGAAPIEIVNPSPDGVRDALLASGVRGADVRAVSSSCESYVDELECRIGAEATSALRMELKDPRPLTVAGAGETVWPVVGFGVDGEELSLEVGSQEREVQLRDTSSWKTSAELLRVLERSGARRIVVTVDGETAHVLECTQPRTGLTDFLVLVPSAIRLTGADAP